MSPRPDAYTVTPERFREHMALVKHNYPIIALKDIPAALSTTTGRTVIVTFDDAFGDFLEYAYPVLAEFTIPATVFVPTRFVGRSNHWDVHVPQVSSKRIMNVRELHDITAQGLVNLGSHTIDHVSMRRLAPREMTVQAAESKKWLEDTFGRAVTTFSYPYGQRDDFSKTTTRVLADAGYEAAVTTCWGTTQTIWGALALRRVHFGEGEDIATVRAKIDGGYDWIALKEQVGFLFRSALLRRLSR